MKLPAPATASFAEVMRREGAVPLAPAPARVLLPKPKAPPAPAAAPAFVVDEHDGWLEGRRARLSPAELAKLRGPPAATLDLHGRDVLGARRALCAFLERERELGRRRVLIIVGKGKHSAGGVGILRSEIGGWLSSTPLSTHVLAFASASPALGGTGGVVVLLAPSANKKR